MLSLAWKNISRRLGSSAITIAVIFVAVFSVVSSSVVLNALNQGADLSRQRLGADVMVLPAGVSSDVESVLFAAQPINVYFSPDVIDQIKSIDGVAKATPQFFTQTVDQSCCSVIGVTRVVGIDPESDFVISPWMKSGSIDANIKTYQSDLGFRVFISQFIPSGLVFRHTRLRSPRRAARSTGADNGSPSRPAACAP